MYNSIYNGPNTNMHGYIKILKTNWHAWLRIFYLFFVPFPDYKHLKYDLCKKISLGTLEEKNNAWRLLIFGDKYEGSIIGSCTMYILHGYILRRSDIYNRLMKSVSRTQRRLYNNRCTSYLRLNLTTCVYCRLHNSI